MNEAGCQHGLGCGNLNRYHLFDLLCSGSTPQGFWGVAYVCVRASPEVFINQSKPAAIGRQYLASDRKNVHLLVI